MATFREWLQTVGQDSTLYSGVIVGKLLAEFEAANGLDEREILERAKADATDGEAHQMDEYYKAWGTASTAHPAAGGDLGRQAGNTSAQAASVPIKGEKDQLGLTVRRVYLKTSLFAIYSADDADNDEDICGLHYALTPSYEKCRELRTQLSAIEPEKAYITDAVCSMRPIWPSSVWPAAFLTRNYRSFRERIFEQVAQGMASAFENQLDQARSILQEAKASVEDRLDSQNRMRYILANTISAVLILLAGLLLHMSGGAVGLVGTLRFANEVSLSVILVLMAGALGAFFSVAIALPRIKIRRSITLSEMFYAGSIRVPVGVIAAGAVVWLIQGGWILSAVASEYKVASVLLFGFLAGFSEMFVPNVLNRVQEQTRATPPGDATKK